MRSERHALAHAAGQLARVRALEALQAELGEQRRRALACLCARHVRHAQRERRVVERVEPRQQQVALGHQHRRLAPQRAGVRRLQSADQLEQRRLAAAARADDREQLAPRHAQRDAGEGRYTLAAPVRECALDRLQLDRAAHRRIGLARRLRSAERAPGAGLQFGGHFAPFAGITPQVLRVGAGGATLPGAISAGLPPAPLVSFRLVADATRSLARGRSDGVEEPLGQPDSV